MVEMFWKNQEAKFWIFWDGDWWRLCYNLKTEVGKAYKCISEVVWVIWLGNAQEILEFGCKKKKKNRNWQVLCLCLQFQVLGNFSKVSRLFLSISRPLYSCKWSSIYRQGFSSLEKSRVQPSYARALTCSWSKFKQVWFKAQSRVVSSF